MCSECGEGKRTVAGSRVDRYTLLVLLGLRYHPTMHNSSEVFQIEFKGSRFSKKKQYLLIAGAVAGVVLLLGLIGLVAWLIVRRRPTDVLQIAEQIPVAQKRRISCFPGDWEGGERDAVDRKTCERNGCTYEPSAFPAVPWCFLPQNGSHGYRVVSGPLTTELGIRWLLRRKRMNGVYGTNVDNVTFDVEYLDNNMLRFKVSIDVYEGRIPHASSLIR